MREARLRLDIVVLPEGTRRTILCDGDTNEIFHWEPFKCSRAADLDLALYPELVDIFPKNNGSYLKFGIGSLWEHVETNPNQVESGYPSSVKLESFLPLEETSSSSKFNKFSYRSTENYKYDLTFHLGDPYNVNTLGIVWIGSKVKLRIMETPNELRQARDQLERVFRLPQGYGCVRLKNKEDDTYSMPSMTFVSSEPEELRLLRLDFVASRPIGDTSSGGYEIPDRWRSHSSSVRILSGGYQSNSGDYERSYLIFEKQESSSDRHSVTQYLSGIRGSRRASVTRTKMVWDMSIMGSDSRSRYFELNMSEGKCLGYGETKSPLDVGIGLTIAPAASDFGQDSPPIMLALGIELLGNLFSPDGFHLISRINHQVRVDKEEFVFEKRDENFKMKNIKGQVVWQGPVSIIRQFVAAKKTNSSADVNHQSSATTEFWQEQQIITINFYSQKLDRLLTRVKLLVAELRTIDQYYLLDEINVSTCLARLGGSLGGLAGAEYVDELQKVAELDENLTFELEYYAVDGEAYVKYVEDQHEKSLKRLIEMDFVRSIIELSNYQLDLMQINNIQVDIRQAEVEGGDSWAVRITGQLLDRPSLLNFVRDIGQRFSDGCQMDKLMANSGGQQIRTLMKESSKACAASCDHFNCTMFTYCSGSSLCDLLVGPSVGNSGVKVTWDPNCVLFTRHQLARSIVSPHQLIHQMDQTIRAQQEQPRTAGDRVSPLGLKLDSVLLVPESIESSLLRGQEFEELAELEDTKQFGSGPANSQQIVSGLRASASLKQEYSLLISDKKYKSNSNNNDPVVFPLAEAKHMSHHDCESLCKQTDCLSYSYCRLERVCQISLLHRKEQIEPKIEQDSGCVVMAREYLTKFQKVSQNQLTPRQTFETIRVDSLNDCATKCMDQAEAPKCRAFYYCPVETGRASCHLKSNKMLADATSEVSRSSPPNPIDSVSSLSCDLYASKYN